MFQKRFKSPSNVVDVGGLIGCFLPLFFLDLFFFLDLNPKSRSVLTCCSIVVLRSNSVILM